MASNPDRHGFECLVKENFRVPDKEFLARKRNGYYYGHLDAYFKLYKAMKEKQAAEIETLKENLWQILEGTAERKATSDRETLIKQIVVDLRAHLDDLKGN